jgi:proline iminopeptidase
MPKQTPLPFHEGHLAAGRDHRFYFAEYGRPDAPVSLVLHGGPGSGCKPSMLDWFDLEQQRVVLLDQRGAGKSMPAGGIDANRTCDLVDDIERLRQHLQVQRWMLVGGSWGATLAICYAGRYPEAVRSLVLRAVFLASRRETAWFFQSLQALVPAGWGRLTAGWTALQKQSVLQTLTVMLQSHVPQEQQDAAGRWGDYEEAVMQAMTGAPAAPAAVDAAWVNKYRVQSHYLANACFMSQRTLFRCALRTAQIPAIVLHGTHDWICPPENATRLMRFMPHAELRWIAKGTHTPSDPAIAAALRHAIQALQHTQ